MFEIANCDYVPKPSKTTIFISIFILIICYTSVIRLSLTGY